MNYFPGELEPEQPGVNGVRYVSGPCRLGDRLPSGSGHLSAVCGRSTEAGPPRANAGHAIMLERRQFIGTALGSILIPASAPSRTMAAEPEGGRQPGIASTPSAAERMNELGSENTAMTAYAGLWDVTETVWDKPGAKPVTTTGLVAERRMIGCYLQEFVRPASDAFGHDIKRIDYLSFQRVEGRWKYVSIETRAPVGIMPAYSFDRGDESGIVLLHDPFAVTGGGSGVAGQMLRMKTIVIRDGANNDFKDQYFTVADGTGTVWLAHRYAYTRKSR